MTSEWEGDRVFNWGEMGWSPPPEEVLGSTLQQPVSSFHCPLQDQDLSVHEVKGSQQSPSNPQTGGKAPGERPASRLSQFMPEQQHVREHVLGADVCPCPPHGCQVPRSWAHEHTTTHSQGKRTGSPCRPSLCN